VAIREWHWGQLLIFWIARALVWLAIAGALYTLGLLGEPDEPYTWGRVVVIVLTWLLFPWGSAGRQLALVREPARNVIAVGPSVSRHHQCHAPRPCGPGGEASGDNLMFQKELQPVLWAMGHIRSHPGREAANASVAQAPLARRIWATLGKHIGVA